MIKISGKDDKLTLTTGSAMIFRSLLKKELHQNEMGFSKVQQWRKYINKI